jgi:Protein of unknown function (DUF1360)
MRYYWLLPGVLGV